MTFQEYLNDYGDDELRSMGAAMIARELGSIPGDRQRERTAAYLDRIRGGERDLRF